MAELLQQLGIRERFPGGFAGEWIGTGELLHVVSPCDGTRIGSIRQVSATEYDTIVQKAHKAFLTWRSVPAPKRGDIIRQLGNKLRQWKKELGALVTLEVGKIQAEGEGEVQEMIDICDFAAGLSRQLYGLTMHSERPMHRMYEQWHPIGVVGIISAFNFPVAVWAWNAAIAIVCGDSTVWKPSPKTPLTAIACTRLAQEVAEANGIDPAVFSLVIGDTATVGEKMLADARLPLVSATGSTAMGRRVAEVVGRRLGRTILELGGNNALVVTPHADLDMALRAILFGAVGTAGQRCTSTRRVIVHVDVRDALVDRLVAAYKTVPIGDPRDPATLMGPLVGPSAVTAMMDAIQKVKQLGGHIIYGGQKLEGPAYSGGGYVTPCIAEAKNEWEVVQKETFAPVLYIIPYGTKGGDPLVDIEEAIRLQNEVGQGLSSAVFTRNLLESERFLAAAGSDCGIANVNIGTSGAEIGGAFGGEKETGGGRESGSDAWKAYMRRQTNTINYGTSLPLAQGIKFG
eukprot:jgi/Mesvir1/10500/Mv15050-RA.1